MASKLIQFFVVLLFVTAAQSFEKGYGDFCDKIQRCDARAFLSCQNEKCDCINPEDMTYDPINRRCVAHASEKCKYAITPSTGESNGNRQFYYADCVPNASCNSEGICVCNNHHVEKPNGTCVEQSGFYQDCESTSECRTNLYLTCMNGTCVCDPESAIDNWKVGFTIRIDHEGHKCVGLADNQCLGGECTKNSVCIKDYMTPGPGTCECKRGMVKSETGLCAQIDFDYDVACSVKEKRFCHPNFSCIRGRCRCKYSEFHQTYDPMKEMCRSFAWGPCDLNGTTTAQCIDNAVCVTNDLTGLPQCECMTGFVENVEGRCDLAFGADCLPSDMTIKCDQMAQLSCRDGKCACEDSLQVFDPTTRRCRGLVGALCNQSLLCVQNAVCAHRYEPNDALGGRGQCQCTNLTKQTAAKTCTQP